MKLKKFKISGYSLLITIIFLTVIILLNVFTGMLTDRFFLKVDLTDTGLYTLSDKAAEFLSDINETVDVVVLSEESAWLANNTLSLVSNVLRNYSASSGGRLRIQYVNPDLNSFNGPVYNNSLSVLKEAHTELEDMARNDIIFISSRRATKVAASGLFMQNYDQYGSPGEINVRTDQELISALVYVLNEKIARIVIVENHQENPTEYLRLIFERSGYVSSTINLALDDIPEDTVVLLSSGPKLDYLNDEIVKLEQYLSLGGNVIILYDFDTAGLPNLDSFLAEWGVAVENKLIFDDEYTFIPQFGVIGAAVVSGAIPFTENAEMFTREISPVGIFFARPLSAVRGEGSGGGFELFPLVRTFSTSSYAKDISGGNITTSERESGDATGPFTLAYNVRMLTRNSESNQVHANLIVSGTNMFDDGFLSMYGDTFYNTMLIAELANDLNPFGERMYIPAKGMSDNQMLVSAGGARMTLILMVIVLPLLIIATGTFIWRKRRHQ